MYILPGPIASVTASPAQEPVSIAAAKAYLRIDSGDEDGVIEGLIKAAREMVETDAEISLLPQTLTWYLDAFPAWEISLRRPPVNSITSITYLDQDGTSQTLAASEYRFDGYSRPARLSPAYNEQWPTTHPVSNAVTIVAAAGYSSVSQVPQMIKQAILMLVGHWYRNREAVGIGTTSEEVAMSYRALLSRITWGGYA
jgi:uncharacterized phiE125 gp8 family phage protein